MKRKYNVGDIYVNNQGESFKIINYIDSKHVEIEFLDSHFKKLVSSGNITKKEVKDPYYPSVEGIGYLGVGTYKPTGKVYKTWHNMIIRCYSNDYHQREPSYKECSVCEEWLNFQNFAKWWHINYLEEGDLDKDLLVKGNKIYSPKYCCVLPKQINIALVKNKYRRGNTLIGVRKRSDCYGYHATIQKYGKSINLGMFATEQEAFDVYKSAKEAYIKELANKFKEILPLNVYNKLLKYEVNETD